MNPITVVKTGSDVQSATGTDILLNSSYPFTKLDTQNIISFQTISILFNKEPPQAPGSVPYYTNTLIYSFPHTYNYIPSVWMMWQNQSPAFPANPSVGSSATTYYPFGDDTAGLSAFDAINAIGYGVGGSVVANVNYNLAGLIQLVTQGLLYAQVDETNVNLYLTKVTISTISGTPVPLYMAGTTLNLRCYVFTEPASTSTY